MKIPLHEQSCLNIIFTRIKLFCVYENCHNFFAKLFLIFFTYDVPFNSHIIH